MTQTEEMVHMDRQANSTMPFKQWPKDKQQEFINEAIHHQTTYLMRRFSLPKSTVQSWVRKYVTPFYARDIIPYIPSRYLSQRLTGQQLDHFKEDAAVMSVSALSAKYGISNSSAHRLRKLYNITLRQEWFDNRHKHLSESQKAIMRRERRRAIMGLPTSHNLEFNHSLRLHIRRTKQNFTGRCKYISLQRGSRTIYYDSNTRRSRIMEHRYGRGPDDPAFKAEHRYRYFDILPISELDHEQQRVAAKHDFYVTGEVV